MPRFSTSRLHLAQANKCPQGTTAVSIIELASIQILQHCSKGSASVCVDVFLSFLTFGVFLVLLEEGFMVVTSFLAEGFLAEDCMVGFSAFSDFADFVDVLTVLIVLSDEILRVTRSVVCAVSALRLGMLEFEKISGFCLWILCVWFCTKVMLRSSTSFGDGVVSGVDGVTEKTLL
jgi:hypothetical protein